MKTYLLNCLIFLTSCGSILSKEDARSAVPTPQQPTVVEGYVQKAFGITVNSVKFQNSEDFYTRFLQTLVIPFYSGMESATVEGQYGLSEFGAGASVYASPASDGRLFETVADGQSRFVLPMDSVTVGDTYKVRVVIRIGLVKGEQKYCYILQSTRDVRLTTGSQLVFSQFETLLTNYQCSQTIGRLQIPSAAQPTAMPAVPTVAPAVSPTATAATFSQTSTPTPPMTPTPSPGPGQTYVPDSSFNRVTNRGIVSLVQKKAFVDFEYNNLMYLSSINWKLVSYPVTVDVKEIIPENAQDFAYQSDTEYVRKAGDVMTRKPFGYQDYRLMSVKTAFKLSTSQVCDLETEVCEDVSVGGGILFAQQMVANQFVLASATQAYLVTKIDGQWTVKTATFRATNVIGVQAIPYVHPSAAMVVTLDGRLASSFQLSF